MAKVSEQFANKFLKTSDFTKEGTVMTVSAVMEEAIGRGQDEKLVMFFKEVEEGFPLNRTNAENLAEDLGDDTDEWEGARVLIRKEKTMYEGKRIDCLRAYAADKE